LKVKFTYIFIFLFGILFFPKETFAQEIKTINTEEPTDDLGNVSDVFQENFFEALKQKGIENYDLALEALDKAEKAAKSEENKAVVFFEKGKNLTQLKQYKEAEENFNKVLKSQGDRMDVMEALYDLYYLENNYEAAIPLVQKLIKIDEDYKEDLANLYSRTQQYDKAITVLDELDETWGESDYRDALRSQIYRQTGNASGQIEKLEEKISSNPKKEQDYLNLIYLYSEEGNTTKAFETARELLKNNPNSQLVHLALYKYYLQENNIEEALRSMKIIFQSSEIEKENKYNVLGDFIAFVNLHLEYEKELENAVNLFSEDNSGKIFEQLGDYYIAKNKKEDALKFYEKGIEKDTDNFSLLKNTLLLQIDFKKYENAAELSENSLEIFPAQPLLYLLNGVANNGLQKADVAIVSLETGLDYLLDNPKMEKDFYNQLIIAYKMKGNTTKAETYIKKASEIKYPN